MTVSAFRALVVDDGVAELRSVDEGMLGDDPVEIDVEFSGLNYKDGMALAGRPGVARISPLIAGIDLAGTVTASSDPAWSAGDRVVLNGSGIGEGHHGGLAERARVAGDSLVRIPDAFTTQDAAAIGTAGFTAALCALLLADDDVAPDAGDVLVTGAAGGVGSVAIALLAARGHRIVASTGRAAEEGDYLRGLGAAEVLDRSTLAAEGRPMQKARWAGAVDSVGGVTLANVLAQTKWGGTVAACGLAGGADLPASVLPFILRAVSLRGANSVDAPAALRRRAWDLLARDLDPDILHGLTTAVALSEVLPLADEILAGRVRGRTVVDVTR